MNTHDPIRLAYLVTHPIQYQAPLLRRVAALPGIALKVFFQSDISVRVYHDPGFGRAVAWDVPLLEGYAHEFLPALGSRSALSRWRPLSHGLGRRLREGAFDVLWVHGYARPFNIAAVNGALRRGMRVLIRDEATAISRPRTAWKERLKGRMLRRWATAGCGFLCIGSLNRAYYRGLGVPEANLFSMPYCVDNAFFQSRAREAARERESIRRELGLGPDFRVILYASKFEPRKRPGDLLAAFRMLPGESHLLFAGDGALRAPLEAEARAAGLARVHFLGFRNQTELPRLFAASDVFVLPSVNEPWGLVVNEAMNAGLPVVVSDRVGCAPDLVREGENGFVVPPGDPAALARALGAVLSDPDRARAMGEASLRIVNGWSFDRDIEGLQEAIHS